VELKNIEPIMKWNQLDLEIQLSPSQAVAMQAMVEKFISRKQQYFLPARAGRFHPQNQF
jgi:hypothetical protein